MRGGGGSINEDAFLCNGEQQLAGNTRQKRVSSSSRFQIMKGLFFFGPVKAWETEACCVEGVCLSWICCIIST